MYLFSEIKCTVKTKKNVIFKKQNSKIREKKKNIPFILNATELSRNCKLIPSSTRISDDKFVVAIKGVSDDAMVAPPEVDDVRW